MTNGLVGRDRELATLSGCLDAAGTGRPQLVICRGEPGVGKTRLARELVVRARGEGFLTGFGAALEASGAPPYWCWWQALREIDEVVSLDELARERGLEAQLSGLRDTGAPQLGTTPEDRFRLFDGVARLVREVARRSSLLLVLDDMHWADEASLRLLQHVVKALQDERLLLVVNARRQAGGPEIDVLATLLSEPVATDLALGGLDGTAVRRHLLELTGRAVDDALVERVRTSTGGNPFFVGEVGRALAAGPDPGRVPVTAALRAAIAERLRILAPAAAEVVRAAAVLGEEVSVPELARLADADPTEVVRLLGEAQDAALLQPAEDATGRWRFAHAIVRDAILDALPVQTRGALHRAAAEALEARVGVSPGAHVFDIAHHRAEAAIVGDDRLVAAGWLERAAVRAMGQLAFEDAALLLCRALALGEAELAPVDRVRLLLLVGRADHLAGNLAGRLRACLDAADVARELGRADLLAEAALVMEVTASAPGFEVVTRRLCKEALAALGPEPTSLRARLLARVVDTHMFGSDLERVAPESDEALAIATACDDPVALGAAMAARRIVCAGPGGLAEREFLAARMLELAARDGDAPTELAAHLWQIDASSERGDLQRVADEVDALARCASSLGWLTARFEVVRCRAVLAQAQGRYADAVRLEDTAYELMEARGLASTLVLRSGLLPVVGRHVGPDRRSMDASAMMSGDTEVLRRFGLIAHVAAAHAQATAGELGEAERLYRAFGPVESWRPPPHVVLLVDAFGIAVSDVLGDVGDLSYLRDRLAAHRGHHVVSGIAQVCYFGPVELWLGVAAHRLGLLDEAVADLEQADARCERAGAAGFRVEAQIRLVAALADRRGHGDLARARVLLGETAPAARRLGMTPYVATAAAVQAEVDRLAGVVALSPRETEVARLVADGLTNREIAARLVLSERTVEQHVRSVLAKLGLANRAQVAAWAAHRVEYHA
ncbi:ATP-binding protein [Kribbella sp. C-35]|uniref:ATP-binding protein n=1 Tax=Kribbella sp. C-35 TaxID=2789276 RepID=UPI003979ED5F